MAFAVQLLFLYFYSDEAAERQAVRAKGAPFFHALSKISAALYIPL